MVGWSSGQVLPSSHVTSLHFIVSPKQVDIGTRSSRDGREVGHFEQARGGKPEGLTEVLRLDVDLLN